MGVLAAARAQTVGLVALVDQARQGRAEMVGMA
jgi:hypothetical protein